MPKERIRDESGVLAQVSWSHDQYVQVATLHTDVPSFLAWCRDLVARVDAAKAANRGADVPHLDPGRMFDNESMGMFWTPNRQQINELIRVLRRARDQAYGRDE